MATNDNSWGLHMKSAYLALASFLSILASSAPAIAAEQEPKVQLYCAVLNGQSPPYKTGSAATARATIRIDRIKQSVAISLDVNGLTTDALWDKLVAAPIGPIHLHSYNNGAITDPNASSLSFPVPYGKAYTPTREGFRVRGRAIDYDRALSTMKEGVDFATFLGAIDSGSVLVNIHTDRFNDGEISGLVRKAPCG